jgi:uncharacterized protein YbjT (DUF2867 family)
MKVTVIGASGLIGTKVVDLLTNNGHEVVAASRNTGVDVITGEGLAEALAGADVLVDVVNSPSFEDDPVLQFFTRSTANLATFGKAAGVGHYVALSIVGVDGLPDSGYMRAKVAQEQLVTDGGVPYTIIRATQFFEFLGGIADSSTTDGTVRLPSAHLQPIAVSDLAVAVADVAEGSPTDGVVEVAGPEAIGLDELVRRVLAATGDARPVVTDDSVKYFGAQIDDASLTPGPDARIAPTRLDDWLSRH